MTTKTLPRRERRSGNERIKRQQPLHINARIQETVVTIIIMMIVLKISVESYIQSQI
jgi:hypothetical protein